jgi:hypothetical protein
VAVSGAVATINNDHPLVKVMKTNMASEPGLERFVKAFIYFVHDERGKKFFQERRPVSTWQRRIGARFLDIKWSQLDQSLLPPYLIAIGGSGIRYQSLTFQIGLKETAKFRMIRHVCRPDGDRD